MVKNRQGSITMTKEQEDKILWGIWITIAILFIIAITLKVLVALHYLGIL